MLKEMAGNFLCALVLRLTLKPLLDKSGATRFLANWKTDWMTGLGVSICVAFGVMLGIYWLAIGLQAIFQ